MQEQHTQQGESAGLTRRGFLKHAATAAALATVAGKIALPNRAEAQAMKRTHAPMALGLLIKPFPDAEARIKLVHDLGFTTCFLSLDNYIGKFTPALAKQFNEYFDKYQVVPTTAEVVQPLPLKWNFVEGPSTIGVVPPAYRAARVDALKQTSDFAKLIGVGRVQTHCGFIPEDPHDPLYDGTVKAIRELTEHCAANGQQFLMETGQETPTTMLRMIKDVNNPALGVGLDTANLILYGKANPVDALKVLGPHVKAMHAKDGKWPTDPDKLGQEVQIGKGEVDFPTVLKMLKQLNYTGAVSIERETSGPQQVQDVKEEKIYLENILNKLSHA
ncbi:sugar phosphate isomerase/epimerase [Terriglobus sp. TAA 43]|uniref:sugar phosphate isomerase/epimerase family protein n=1 Tax=Terriglobus sp. TAA 43 TaxID=278961 RepID=UPI0009FE0F13|nr:sugar phosphate isomerase/epimerase family protein [Terriglobus sp. TAA 43]